MPINNHKTPAQWQTDTLASVAMYNKWFLTFAPQTFRAQRLLVTGFVGNTIIKANDLLGLTPIVLINNPDILRTLRMCCCPPIAVDRLSGLAKVSNAFIKDVEAGIPKKAKAMATNATKIVSIVNQLLDEDLFHWLPHKRTPTDDERNLAAQIVADRLTGSMSNPIIRNEQEKRQLAEIEKYLNAKGYVKQAHPSNQPLANMAPGTFAFRMVIIAGNPATNIPIDCVIQPKSAAPGTLPILIEAKSAGDFANTNKRRKEESDKMGHIQVSYAGATFVLFLCGYFGKKYLQHSANAGLDWIWEHRISDMDLLGL